MTHDDLRRWQTVGGCPTCQDVMRLAGVIVTQSTFQLERALKKMQLLEEERDAARREIARLQNGSDR